MDTRPGSKDIFPCRNCADRAVGCHGVCEDYAKAVEENKRRKEVDEVDKATRNPIIHEGSFTGDSGFRKRIRK